MVSIGKPEVGKQIVEHLELTNGDEYLFVDPETVLYDELDLNRGVKETFFTMSTPFAFLDRLITRNGMDDVMKVLSKYNKGLVLPPKLKQGLNQGGTFVFDGSKTLLAHYDESTAAHADIEEVVSLAKKAVAEKAAVLA